MSDHHDDAVRALLDRFARAFTKGDGPGAAACWEVPALVVSDEGSRAVGSLDEVAAFFGGAAGQYHDLGVADTRAEVQSIRWITERQVLVEVLWPYLDADGQPTGRTESSVYVMRLGDNGQPRIAAVLMMGTSR
jgi:hypothetical protein